MKSVARYGSGARGVAVMRLNAGDEVAGIAVFRAGAPEGLDIGDNAGPEDGAGAPS